MTARMDGRKSICNESILCIIRDALRERRLLRLNYRHFSRLVQPKSLNIGADGDLVLVAQQISGGCESGQVQGLKEFRLPEITGASALPERY